MCKKNLERRFLIKEFNGEGLCDASLATWDEIENSNVLNSSLYEYDEFSSYEEACEEFDRVWDLLESRGIK